MQATSRSVPMAGAGWLSQTGAAELQALSGRLCLQASLLWSYMACAWVQGPR